MKNPCRLAPLIFLTLLLLTLLFAETFIVKIQTTNLRKEPKFYAQTLAILKAGEKVEKLSIQEGWLQVKNSKGLVGWIHSSSAEPKKFSLLALDKSLKTKASASEVALAGKGFNKQVEESYRARNPGISFAQVDRMLKIRISPLKIRAFLKQGKLGEFRAAE